MTVTDANGCTASIAAIVIESTNIDCDDCTLAFKAITVINDNCQSDEGVITVGVFGTPANYTYAWTPSVSTTNQASGLSAGTYTVTVTDPSIPGCSIDTTIVVGNTDAPAVTVQRTPATCTSANGTASVVQGGLTYAWSTGATTQSISGLASGVYSVTVTNPAAPNCPTIRAVVIGRTNPLTANFTINAEPNCNAANGSVTITTGGGSGNYGYVWSDGGSGATRSNLSAGMYVVTVTDNSTGCTATTAFTLTDQASDATVSINATEVEVSCVGSTDGTVAFNVSYGAGFAFPQAVTIEDAAGTAYINGNLAPGDYCVIVRDANGCTAGQACFTVIEPTTINVVADKTDKDCNMDGTITLTVTGGAGNYTYDWADVAGANNAANRTGLDAGTYSVTVTDANGCTASIQQIILENQCPVCQPPVVASTTIIDATCNNSDGSATVNIVGGSAGYTFAWSGGVSSTTSTATNLSAGSYVVTITDVTDATCFTTVTVTIDNLDGPPAVLQSTTPATCDAADGTATIAAPAGLAYAWSDGGASSAIRTNLAAGTYTVTVTDPSLPNCPTIVQVTIGTQSPLTVVETINTQPTCGSADGSVTLTVSNGSGNYTYSWGGGATRDNLAAGTYSVTITDAVTNCTAVATFTLTDDVAPASVSAPAEVSTSCVAGSDATIAFTVTYSSGFVAPADTTITDNLGNVYANGNLSAGNYCIVITDANGCVAGQSCFEVVSPDAIEVMVTSTNDTCNIDGTIILSVSGGTAPYTYDWADLASTDNMQNRIGLMEGTYSVTVTDANGCTTAVNDILITNTCVECVEPVVSNTTSMDATCGNADGSATITVSNDDGSFVYAWSGGVSNSNTATGLAAGTYAVTITNPITANCTTVATVTIGNQDGPMVTVTGTTDATCDAADGTATLSPSGLTYVWSDGGSGATRTNLAAGTYTVTATDAATPNCPAIETVTIGSVSPLASTATVNTQPTCGNADGSVSISVSNGSGNYAYSWGGGATRNDLAAGTYTVTITDNVTNCTTTVTFTLTDDVAGATVVVDPQVSTSCAGINDGTVNITISPSSGFVAPATVTITDGTNTFLNGNLAPGNYCVVVTDGNGCFAGQDCFVVVAPDQIVVSATTTDDTCAVAGTITLTVSGGTAPYTYDWADVPGTNNSANRTGLDAGTYSVTVTDDNGCTAVMSNILIDDTCVPCVDPVVTGTMVTDATCGNADGMASVSVAGNLSDYAFQWQPSLGTANAQGNARTGLPAGIYSVVITDTVTAGNCSTTTTITIGNTDGPQASIVSTTNATCDAADGTATLSPANFIYQWSDGGTGATRSNLAAGTYQVIVLDPTLPNCSNNLTVTIGSANPLMVEAVTVTEPTCGDANGTVSLNVTGGSGSYTYSTGSTNTITGLAAGTYSVTVTDNVTNCVATTTFTLTDDVSGATVTINAQPSVSCAGDADATVFFTVNEDAGFAFPSTVTIEDAAGNVFTNGSLAAGNYCVVVTDANGCVAGQGCFTVVEPTVVMPVATVTNVTCTTTGSILLTVTGGTAPYSYDWADLAGSNDPQNRNALNAGTYSVTVTDSEGCVAVLSNILVGDDCNPSCVAEAGTLTLNDADGVVCLNVGGTTNISATPNGDAIVPAGFTTLYVLTTGTDLVIIDAATTPSFNVTDTGLYTIHTLVYDAATLDLNIVTPGVTQASEILAIIVPNGTICADLDAIGAPVQVIDCTTPPIDVTPDTVFVTIPVSTSDTVCVVLESSFNAASTTYSLCDGSTGGNSAFGNYTVENGCLIYNAGTTAGFLVDELCVVATDNGVSDTTIIYVSITDNCPPTSVDSVTVQTTDCDDCANVCVNIPFTQINNFEVIVDGQVYTGSYSGCDFDTVFAYTYFTLFNQGNSGPYTVQSWTVNGQMFSGTFDDPQGLVDFMNSVDPAGNWELRPSQLVIVGGVFSKTYGTIKVVNNAAANSMSMLNINDFVVANGAAVCVPQTTTSIVIGELATGCADTIFTSFDCNPLPVFTPDTLFVTVPVNETATECVDLEPGFDDGSVTYVICDSGTGTGIVTPFGTAVVSNNGCLTYDANATAGPFIDTICVAACNGAGICDTTIFIITITDGSTPITVTPDTIPVTVEEGSVVVECVTLEPGFGTTNIAYSLCDGNVSGSSAFGTYIVDASGCLSYSANPNAGGNTDEVCVIACNATGLCDTTIFIVTITDGVSPPVITPDTVFVTVPVNTSDTSCVTLEASFNAATTTYSLCDNGLSPFGTYSVDADGCLIFNAGSTAGINLDTLCVVAEDNGVLDTTIFIVTITDQAPTFDTIPFTLDVNTSLTVCGDLPSNFGTNLTTVFVDGTTSGSNAFGSYTIANDSCITYTAGSTPGEGVDTITMIVCDLDLNECYTVTFIPTIIDNVVTTPTPDTVALTVFVNETDSFCVELEPNFDPATTTYSLCDGSTAGSSIFGDYFVSGGGCLVYTADTLTGFELETICVVACDAALGQCDTTFVVITITPPDCPEFFSATDETVQASSCDSEANYCIDIPIAELLLNYEVYDNGQLYNNGYAGCAFDSVIAYTYFTLLGQGNAGPYFLNSWTVNGVTYSGAFPNVPALVDSMNVWDPTGNWSQISSSLTITGGDFNKTYSEMLVTQTTAGSNAIIGFNIGLVANGSRVRLDTGMHQLIVVETATGCSDTVMVNVECPPVDTCPEFFAETEMVIPADDCNSTQNAFCLNLSLTELLDYQIFDNGTVYSGNYLGCDLDSVLSYTYFTLLNQGNSGPYMLNSWTVNGVTYSGQFQNPAALVDSMNTWDPTGNWVLEPGLLQIVGGDFNNTYSSINASQVASGAPATFDLNNSLIANAAALSLDTGMHQIVILEIATGCTDTIDVNVVCTGTEVVTDSVPVGESDTLCIDLSELTGPVVSITNACEDASGEDVLFTIDTATNCVVYTGVSVGADTACIVVCDANGVCDTTTIIVETTPFEGNVFLDTIAVNETDTLCLATDLTAAIQSVVNVCEDASGTSAVFAVDAATLCVAYTGILTGTDTACIVITDVLGNTDTTTIIVTTVPAPTPEVFVDTVDVNETNVLCINDPAVTGTIVSVENVCEDAADGNVTFVIDTATACITYTGILPGTDTACIVITDNLGNVDTTTMIITTVTPVDPLTPTVVVDSVPVGVSDTLCIVSNLTAPIVDIENVCDSDGNVEFVIDTATNCVIYTGLVPGIDTACIVVTDSLGNTDTTTLIVTTTPVTDPNAPQLIENTLFVGATDTVCVDVTALNGTIASIENTCTDAADGNISVSIDAATGCVIHTGLVPGVDSLCLTIIDTDGDSVQATIVVTVIPVPTPSIVFDTVMIGMSDTLCVDVTQLPGNVVSIENFCADISGDNVLFTIDPATYCVTYSGITAGVDTACIVVTDDLGNMDTTTLIVTTLPMPTPDTHLDTVLIGSSDVYCLDTTELIGTIISVENICEGASGDDVEFTIDTATACITFTGLDEGTETGCFVITDNLGNTDTTTVIVTVLPNASMIDTLYDVVEIGSSTEFTFAPGTLPGDLITITNFCDGISGGFVDFVVDPVDFSITYTGVAVGTDTACIEVCDNLGNCDTTIFVVEASPALIVGSDSIYVDTITLSESGTVCVDVSDLNGNIVSVTDLCPDASGESVVFDVDNNTFCVDYEAISVGTDSICLQICDDLGQCDTAYIIVTVVPDAPEIIVTDLPLGDTDTICIDSELPGTIISVENVCDGASGTFVDFEIVDTCIVFTGIAVGGPDTACIVITDDLGNTDSTTIIVTVTPPAAFTPEEVVDTIEIGEVVSEICVDTTELPGTIISIENVCDDLSGDFVEFFVSDTSFCIEYVGLAVGTDTACIVITDNFGNTDTTYYYVTVVDPAPVLLPIAVNDTVGVFVDANITIPVLENDTINGSLVSITPLDPPLFGSVMLTMDNEFLYTPNGSNCDVQDSFTYEICNANGCDTATVYLEVRCEEVIIYSGFSPNNDGVNDNFIITGIEDLPNNTLLIFNRWGNKVYEANGYNNTTTVWDGTWNGNPLPDGTYFYVLDNGNGRTYSGSVTIHR